MGSEACVELEAQLLDKRRMVDAIKRTFKVEVYRLYDTIRRRYQTTIATLDEARQYTEQYNEPELLDRFEAADTEENGKKTYHPIGFLPAKARKQAEELIFEELRPYFMFFYLQLIDEELEDNYSLTQKWKQYMRRHQDWKYKIGAPDQKGMIEEK
jgi:hypothetical protein